MRIWCAFGGFFSPLPSSLVSTLLPSPSCSVRSPLSFMGTESDFIRQLCGEASSHTFVTRDTASTVLSVCVCLNINPSSGKNDCNIIQSSSLSGTTARHIYSLSLLSFSFFSPNHSTPQSFKLKPIEMSSCPPTGSVLPADSEPG